MDSSRTAAEYLLSDPEAAVRLRAPGRLHLGFLDPAGSLGRRFGSLGLVVNGFETEVELGASAEEQVSASGRAERAEVERAAAHLHLLRKHTGRHEPLQLKLLRVLPAHAGFGSGTQLALAIGRAFSQWHGLDIATPTLAQWLGRGVRSGVGIAGFDHGGLLLDGGPRADGAPASVLSRIALPQAWRVLVVQDSACQGLSGADERNAMATLSPLPRSMAADICHQVLMRVLPGAAGAEFAPFAAGINRMQQLLGEHFASAQGGSAFTSPAVGHLLEWIGSTQRDRLAAGGNPDNRAGQGEPQVAEPVAAIGQSSWGPTGFAILPSQAQAEAMIGAARAAMAVAPSLTLRIVSGRSSGATVIDRRAAPQPR
jgi:beta-ribofuranosylaminobenzene 5'-phosphate synthase